MQKQQTNKDLPANPVQFMDKFSNQMIILAGFTKQEIVALEIFKSIITHDSDFIDSIEERKFVIKECYEIADEFCSYLEK